MKSINGIDRRWYKGYHWLKSANKEVGMGKANCVHRESEGGGGCVVG